MVKGVVVTTPKLVGPNWELCEFCVRGLASALVSILPEGLLRGAVPGDESARAGFDLGVASRLERRRVRT